MRARREDVLGRAERAPARAEVHEAERPIRDVELDHGAHGRPVRAASARERVEVRHPSRRPIRTSAPAAVARASEPKVIGVDRGVGDEEVVEPALVEPDRLAGRVAHEAAGRGAGALDEAPQEGRHAHRLRRDPERLPGRADGREAAVEVAVERVEVDDDAREALPADRAPEALVRVVGGLDPLGRGAAGHRGAPGMSPPARKAATSSASRSGLSDAIAWAATW